MARTVTEYGPPASSPCTRNKPFSRVRVPVVYPVLRFAICTFARTTGWPCSSVTLPVIAPVVTPWAATGSAASIENTTAATTTHGARTIHGIVGSLPCNLGCVNKRAYDAAETGPRWEVRQGRWARGTVARAYVGAFLRSHTPAAPNSRLGIHAATGGGRAPPAPTAFDSWNIRRSTNVVARHTATPQAMPVRGVEIASGAPNSAMMMHANGTASFRARSTRSFFVSEPERDSAST